MTTTYTFGIRSHRWDAKKVAKIYGIKGVVRKGIWMRNGWNTKCTSTGPGRDDYIIGPGKFYSVKIAEERWLEFKMSFEDLPELIAKLNAAPDRVSATGMLVDGKVPLVSRSDAIDPTDPTRIEVTPEATPEEGLALASPFITSGPKKGGGKKDGGCYCLYTGSNRPDYRIVLLDSMNTPQCEWAGYYPCR